MRGRNATPGVLAVGIALIMIGVSLTLRSEAQRATAVLIAAGSIGYAWVRLRNYLQSWLGLGLLGTGLLTLAIACTWSGLNVVRFCLYDPAIVGTAVYSTWYEIVCTTQVILQWCGAVLALAFVVVLAVFPFWTRMRSAREN
jgi:hypothetical protein